MNFVTFLLNIFDPFKIVRNYILKPAITMAIVVLEEYKNKTKKSVQTTKNVILRFTIFAFVAFVVIWTSIFMYAYFYYSYMPAVSHTKDVQLNYKQCEYLAGRCESYPEAAVTLTKKQQLLMVGQPYKVYLFLEMPESDVNYNAGMFTVCAVLRDQAKAFKINSCRLAMLHYKSSLLKMITTWVTSPLLILGYLEEKQTVSIELFSSFEDDQTHPITHVDVQIQSKELQLYSVQLHISAHFTGLRYFMFHWPVLSAVVGISTNLFFILIICILSWYHWDDTEWLDDVKEKYKKISKKSEEILASTISNVGVTKDDLNEENPETSEISAKSKELSTDDDSISIIDEISSFKTDDEDYFFDDDKVRQRIPGKVTVE